MSMFGGADRPVPASSPRPANRYQGWIRSATAAVVVLLGARAIWGMVEWGSPALVDGAGGAAVTLVRVLVVALAVLAVLVVPFVVRPRLVPLGLALLTGIGAVSAAALWQATAGQPSASLTVVAGLVCAVACVVAGLSALNARTAT